MGLDGRDGEFGAELHGSRLKTRAMGYMTAAVVFATASVIVRFTTPGVGPTMPNYVLGITGLAFLGYAYHLKRQTDGDL